MRPPYSRLCRIRRRLSNAKPFIEGLAADCGSVTIKHSIRVDTRRRNAPTCRGQAALVRGHAPTFLFGLKLNFYFSISYKFCYKLPMANSRAVATERCTVCSSNYKDFRHAEPQALLAPKVTVSDLVAPPVNPTQVRLSRLKPARLLDASM